MYTSGIECYAIFCITPKATVRRKILTGENIDEFDKFLAIRQYFPYQNFPFR